MSKQARGKMVTTAVLLVVAGLSTAQAADTTLTLACQGTTTSGVEDAKPEPISMGIIVNFTNRTVQGFGDPGLVDFPVKITGMNEVTVSFYGEKPTGPNPVTNWSIRGTIDL